MRDRAIERQLAAGLLDDLSENAEILLERIGIEGGHDAAHAKLRDIDDHLAGTKGRARPGTLRLPRNAANNDIWAQTTKVHAEPADRSIGGHEQRQDIEPSGVLAGVHEAHGFTGGPASEGERFRGVPWISVDHGYPLCGDGSLESKQAGMRARGDDSVTGVRDDHDVAVSVNPGLMQRGFGDPFAAHAFDWVTP